AMPTRAVHVHHPIRACGQRLTRDDGEGGNRIRTMSEEREVSRRWFVRTTLTGAAAGLAWTAAGGEAGESRSHSTDDELTELTIREASELARRKKVSPVELTEASLTRIERFNPTLNAFITVTSDAAMAQARTAEAEIQRGRWRGPLRGIPIALKDLFDTAGVRTTGGSGIVGLKPTYGLVSTRGVIPVAADPLVCCPSPPTRRLRC